MKQSSIINWSLIAMVLALGALVGCGGGSSSDSSNGALETTVTTSSRSKAEFVKLANAICERDKANLLAELGTYFKKHGSEAPSPSQAAVQAIEGVVLPKIEREIEEIGALGAPRGEEEKVESFLAALKEGLEAEPNESSSAQSATPANQSAAGSGGIFGEANEEFTKDFKRSAALATQLGLDACSYG